MTNPPPIHRHNSSEDGFTLLGVMFMLFLFAIWLTVAVPEVAKSIQRDREIETMHRGEQYVRAIQLYYRKFGAYPPSMDALAKTSDIRFLRKKYIDPMTGKEDWKPMPYDPLHPPVALGFFGQPLAGAPVAGTGPSGGNTPSGGPVGGGSSGITGGGLNAPGSIFGGSSTLPSGAAPGASSAPGGLGSSGSTASSSTGASSTGASATGTGSSPGGSTGSSAGSSFMSGQSGQTFGGAGIVGVTLPNPKQSILIYKKQDHYNKWQFTYSPLTDMQNQAGGGNAGIGTPAGQTSGTGTTGAAPSSPGLGGGSSFGGGGMSGPGSSSPGGLSGSPSPQPQQ